MKTIRSFFFMGLALLGAALFMSPASAMPRYDHSSVYAVSPHQTEHILFDLHAVTVPEHAKVCNSPDAVKPVAFRSISVLKPVYLASLETDGHVFIDPGRGC
ncbi:hypothetical protein IFT84_13580 [Rhizobium sp. CFBP 8762]|uniref:hypothetical protein n=1 Tax=Rhizobium sp. CFBP 8762 TaxID=2775279 RepID=UPI00177E280A|nr:hypothetical protein [Rhizobium sp. CFBP 8762]MBD8555538.1 hypothetical protein [Rhizobium sp. CFBP 8762]